DDTEDGSVARDFGLPKTVTVITGSGKRHYLFKAPMPPIGNSASKLRDHVDVRGEGGQVVFVGSVHPETGKPYRWLEGPSPDEIQMAELPADIVERLRTRESVNNGRAQRPLGALQSIPPELRRYAEGALRRSVSKVATAAEGQRNNILN